MGGQFQKQISKSKQIQDQAYSYGVMGNIFSALEWYAKRSSNKNQLKIHFEHYNNFNCGKMKSLEDLRNQIIVQLEIFKVSYKLYVIEHGAYEFPPSLSKEQIIKYIKQWEEYIPEKDIPLYETAINIITDKKVDSFVSELKGDGKYINPKTALDMTKVVGHSQQMGAKVLREYEKNGDYKVDMEIDKEEVGEKNLQKVGKDRQKRLKMETDLKNIIEETVRLIEKRMVREYEKNGDYKVDMEIDKEEVGEKNLQKVGIDRQERLKMETDLKNKIEEIVQLIEKRMGEKGIRVEKCYMTNKPNCIVHMNKNDKRTSHKIGHSIEEFQKMLNQYEKIGVYYYNDNKTDLDKLCAHCEKLSSQCAGKKLTILVYLIDSFVKLLQSTKEDNQQ